MISPGNFGTFFYISVMISNHAKGKSSLQMGEADQAYQNQTNAQNNHSSQMPQLPNELKRKYICSHSDFCF